MITPVTVRKRFRVTTPSPATGFAPVVRDSFAHCRAITKKRATNFYYALRLTPEPKRSAMYAIYATLRACDDAVDGAPNFEVGQAYAQRWAALQQFERCFDRACDAVTPEQMPPGSIWPAFRFVLDHYPIDPACFRLMIQGQRDDLEGVAIEDFDDLYRYCYYVASTVGRLCLSVWGHGGDDEATHLAEQRGIALQLTNILRDLREDALNNRCYLPATELEGFDCDPEAFCAGRVSRGFDEMMRFQVDRARAYYEASAPLERYIAVDCRATSEAIATLYRSILERMAADPRRVLRERVRLSTLEKLRLARRSWWQQRRVQRG